MMSEGWSLKGGGVTGFRGAEWALQFASSPKKRLRPPARGVLRGVITSPKSKGSRRRDVQRNTTVSPPINHRGAAHGHAGICLPLVFVS